MANAAAMAKAAPARVLIVGYPGSAKTGSLCSLVDAGFKLRVLDYDGNLEPLLRFSDPKMLENVDIISLEDKLRGGAKFVEVSGVPTAFADGLKYLDRWKYTDERTGEEVDLGRSKDWGPDTVVVVDSLTSMGAAAKRRAMAMLNKTPLNFTQQGWGLAMADQEAFVEKLTSQRNRHHVVVLAHLKMVGPEDIQQGDESTTKELKERAAEIVPTRLYPSALGRQLPQNIGQHFPTLLLAENKHKGGNKVEKVLRTVPRPELDLKVPAPDMPTEMPISNGLRQVFDAVTGGVEQCLTEGAKTAPAKDEGETE